MNSLRHRKELRKTLALQAVGHFRILVASSLFDPWLQLLSFVASVTLTYRPPELLLNYQTKYRYDFSVDIWSAGCVTGEMLLAQPLFPACAAVGVLKKIRNGLNAFNEGDWPINMQNHPCWKEIWKHMAGESGKKRDLYSLYTDLELKHGPLCVDFLKSFLHLDSKHEFLQRNSIRPEKRKPAPPEAPPQKRRKRDDMCTLTVKELRQLCKERGPPCDFTKELLLEQLCPSLPNSSLTRPLLLGDMLKSLSRTPRRSRQASWCQNQRYEARDLETPFQRAPRIQQN